MYISGQKVKVTTELCQHIGYDTITSSFQRRAFTCHAHKEDCEKKIHVPINFGVKRSRSQLNFVYTRLYVRMVHSLTFALVQCQVTSRQFIKQHKETTKFLITEQFWTGLETMTVGITTASQ